MRRLSVLAVGGLPMYASAHGNAGLQHWWTFDPLVWLPMVTVGGLYMRGILALRNRRSTAHAARLPGIASFLAAMAATFFALVWPLDALGAVSLAAHMAQHMLLIAVAAPLFAFAEPTAPLLVALPVSWRGWIGFRALGKAVRVLSLPGLAFAVHGALVWLWHAPLLFESALRWRWMHVIEHVAFLGSALVFWNALQKARRTGAEGYGMAALWTLATLIHTGLLGALLTFSPRLLYPTYAGRDHVLLTPLEDQQLAGLLMWIPGGACYLAAGLCYAAAWLRGGDRRMFPAGKE